MAAIDALAFAIAAGFAVVVATTVLVIIGVRQEERRCTIENKRPHRSRDCWPVVSSGPMLASSMRNSPAGMTSSRSRRAPDAPSCRQNVSASPCSGDGHEAGPERCPEGRADHGSPRRSSAAPLPPGRITRSGVHAHSADFGQNRCRVALQPRSAGTC